MGFKPGLVGLITHGPLGQDDPLRLNTFAWPNTVGFKTCEGWAPPKGMGFDPAITARIGL